MSYKKWLILFSSMMALVLYVAISTTSTAQAAEYYVSPSGDDGNAGTIGSPWESIGKANATLLPGDTVFLREGVYNQAIAPTNSGTEGEYITYQVYEYESAIISDTNIVIDLSGKNYILIDGIRGESNQSWANLSGGSSYNIIRNSDFIGDESTTLYTGMSLANADYNQIVNNRLIGTAAGPHDLIGIRPGNYNLIANNTVEGGLHIAVSISGKSGPTSYNIVKDNIITNRWHTALGVWRVADHTIVEGNFILDAGEDHAINFIGSERDRILDRNRQNGMQIGSSELIIRNNIMVNNGHGMTVQSYGLNEFPDTDFPANDNRFYNNTFYKNYEGYAAESPGPVDRNILKNNIFEGQIDSHIQRSPGNLPYEIEIINNDFYDGVIPSYVEMEGNLTENPLFVDASNLNFHLQNSSPLIDNGHFLTTTTSSGSGALLPVEDARYFTDGYGIIEGDLIQLEGQSITARVLSISGNTLSLDTSLTWNDDQSVSLAYTGNAPEIGALEYQDALTDTVVPSTPVNLVWTEKSGTTIDLAWEASIDNVGVTSYDVYNGSTLVGTTASTSYSVTGLTEETAYSFTVKAKDAANFESQPSRSSKVTTASNSQTITNDLTKPTVTITSPADDDTVSNIVTVFADAADNVGVVGVQFKLNGLNLGVEDTSAPYSIQWDTTGSTNDTHALMAVVRDAANNKTTSEPIWVTTDNEPARVYEAELLTISDSSGGQNQLVNHASASGGQYLLYRSEEIGTYVSLAVDVPLDIPYEVSIGFDNNPYRGIIQMSVDGIDYGPQMDLYDSISQFNEYNIGTMQFNSSEIVEFTFTAIDNNPESASYHMGIDYIKLVPRSPVIVTPQEPITSNQNNPPVIEVIAAEGITVEVLKDDVVYGSALGQGDTVVAIELNGVDEGVHNFTARAIDRVGNKSGRVDIPAITFEVAPPAAPTDLAATAVSATQVDLSWTAPIDEIVEYIIYRDGLEIGTAVTNSYNDAGLTLADGTTFTYTVKGVNAYDLISENSNEAAVNLLDSYDGLQELIDAYLLIGDLSHSTAQQMGNKIGQSQHHLENGRLVQAIKFLNDAIDILNKGNSSAAVKQEFTDILNSFIEQLEIFYDTDAPTVPSNLASIGKGNWSVDLTWDASTDNVGVVGYDIYVDSVLVDTTTSTSHTVVGLQPNTTYTFTVKAKDISGNVSTESSQIQETTLNTVGPLTILSSTASSQNNANVPPEKSYDGDLNTWWTSSGVEKHSWVIYDFGSSKEVSEIELAFISGEKRVYHFEVLISEDGTTWHSVYTGGNSGTTADLEAYELSTGVSGRYMQLYFSGYSENGEYKADRIIIKETNVFGISAE